MEDISNDLGKWVLPLATGLIAWGGYPHPPDAFINLTQYELFRYALLFILIWQGGAQQDLKTAFIATAIFYFVVKIFEIRAVIQSMQRPQMEIRPMPIQTQASPQVPSQTPQIAMPMPPVAGPMPSAVEAKVEHFYKY